MLCHVCIGVLQYRQNILVPGTIDDEEVYFEDSEDSEHSNDDEKGCISNQSQARDTDKLPSAPPLILRCQPPLVVKYVSHSGIDARLPKKNTFTLPKRKLLWKRRQL
jgi:hypothetical protein